MASAPDPAPVERMEELLTCSFCKQTLNEPRTLPCFHSFCKKCLLIYTRIQRREARKEGRDEHLFNCPTCRTQFEDENVKSIDFVTNMVDILKIQQKAQKLPCESWNGEYPAERRCVQCESYLCKNCLETHNNWPAFNRHDLLNLKELAKPENQAKAQAKPRCDKNGHENKPLEFCCNTCHELSCMSCVVLDHPKPEHDCQPTGVVAKQMKEYLKTTSTFLKKKSNECQNALQKIKRASQNLQAMATKCKRNTAALIVEVDRKHNKVNQKLVKQHDDMEAYVEKVNGSLEFGKSITEKGSDEEIITLANGIKLNAKDIEKKCPKSMLPGCHGFFDYQQKKSAKNVVDKLDLDDLGKIGKFVADFRN